MKTKNALSSLSALAQETRLAIFRHLVEIGPEGSPVGAIRDALKQADATLSFHLKELSQADLLVSRQDGRFIWYAANFDTMNALIAYLTENCCGGKPEQCGPACAPAATSKKSRRRIPT
jgi:ArsR family transcriptional regulator, arsenate/arsenite/antimonite-responsive transcriptional repressor